MAKKYTWDKNGKMTSEDEKPDNQHHEHYCIKGDQIDMNAGNIEILFKRINGDGIDPGMFTSLHLINEKLNGLIEVQKNNKLWVRGAVFAFSLFILGLIYFGITDHNAINAMPDYLKENYYNKEASRQMLEVQSQLNIMLQNADYNNSKDIEKIRIELEKYDKFFTPMRATRGGNTSENKTKLPGGIDPDKLYNELTKQKEAGTDTGTYLERVNRIDKNLLK